ncbi:PLP-dependent aminotransferase family protein [Planomonospora sp. ID67723]|uniref:MocR-like pyridoxine biosynthesis transcription factor PdxR n=1 Tax=Planomonospora sp. ID67723 TaxID=2738134 RepID=UPI0018C409FC|nr:PLP-dependent aminotransferase family protein [Planomonospora sp. ID67723]MBG0829696.1 PLP-dependent aminotransferase family protein [Planomonospora sp. ID67723]
MEFHIGLAGRGDLAARIYRQLREAVLDGRLQPGERLPPTRELAGRLGVARNTVTVAYDRLTAEGFLTGKVGAGTFVCAQPLARARPRNAPAGGDVRPRPVWRSIPAPDGPGHAAPGSSTAGDGRPLYDFRVGTPDPALFPLETWRRLVARELSRSTVGLPEYAQPAGHAGLREAIARYVGVSRSVHAGAGDVLVTQGAQQALDLVGRVLIEPGDRVAVEEPGYPPARLLFRSLGARVTGVPVDAEGLDVAALPDDTRLVYVTPSHQFPLGTPMSLPRRAALLAWAQRHDAVVIEDDYDSEYRFGGRPLESLQSLDRCGRVVYVGSFSKTLLPMLRLGFLVAPASLRPALLSAKRLADWHGDLIAQGALARFIDEGLLSRHIRKTTREYAARHAKITTVLRERFADRLRPVPSAAGLHLCARLAPDAAIDLEQVVARARGAGVGVESLAGYCGEEPAQAGLVLGYGAVRPERIDEGLRLLAECFGAG